MQFLLSTLNKFKLLLSMYLIYVINSFFLLFRKTLSIDTIYYNIELENNLYKILLIL